jgi:hypothetical protein
LLEKLLAFGEVRYWHSNMIEHRGLLIEGEIVGRFCGALASLSCPAVYNRAQPDYGF